MAVTTATVGSYSTTALRDLRLQKALTLDELSAMAGVSRAALWCAETGRTFPRPRIRRRIAAALGVTPDQLLTPTPAAEA